MKTGSFVVFHLAEPAEKLWGVLDRLGPEGITFRGISLTSFDDWVRGIVREEQMLGLSTQFVPLFRVRSLYLDEAVGAVESYSARFERDVGMTPAQYLGLEASTGSQGTQLDDVPPS